MIVEIVRSSENGKYSGFIDGKEVTKDQTWLWQCLTKMMKYAKSQGV